MNIEIYYSDDYAGLISGNKAFYYGYEVTDSSDEWCFQVKIDGVENFRKTSRELEDTIKDCDFRDSRDYLLAGIGLWLLNN